MGTIFAPLVQKIREAFALDERVPDHSEVPADIVALMRRALQTDRATAGASDLALATSIEDLLPRVSAKTSDMYESLRQQLTSDSPWALVALDSTLDLLSPLGKARHEPSHTKTLGFLMDPGRPHGLGVRVLREFFKLMGRLIPGEDPFERLAEDSLQSTDTLRQIRVTTEHANEVDGRAARCDLWLELEDANRSLIVVVENKVESSEHNDQLRTYEDALWRRAKERRRLNLDARLVFLTPDGRLPDQEYDRTLWLPMTYTNLAACLAHASRDAPEPGRTYLNLYASTILRVVLGVPANPVGMERVRQLPFLTELQNQGATS